MASRNFNRLQALQKEVKHIHAQVTIGGTGAPTLVAAKSLGVASISRTGTGVYEITLQDKYMDLVNAHVSIMTPTAEDISVNLVSEAVDSTKKLVIRTTAAGVATDPASGDALLITLELKNSSVTR